jgi:probable rRNA maturation factor
MFEDIGNDEMLSNKDNSDCNEVLKAKKTSTRILTRIPTNQIFITSKNTKEANFGDIVISLEKALEQSQEYGHSFEREVAFLTVHSVLHLLGYDHIEAKDEKKMIKRQKQIMTEIETELTMNNL